MVQTCQTVGMPGCCGPLMELIMNLAEVLKLTQVYEGYNCTERLVKLDQTLLVPDVMHDMPVVVIDSDEQRQAVTGSDGQQWAVTGSDG